MTNVKIVTEYSVSGKRGGYRLKWVGTNKPSYIVGVHGTFCWYKFKSDAASAAANYN